MFSSYKIVELNYYRSLLFRICSAVLENREITHTGIYLRSLDTLPLLKITESRDIFILSGKVPAFNNLLHMLARGKQLRTDTASSGILFRL